jgi:hypothetical protein
VPFVHVASVEASLAFYAKLGFSPREVMRDGRSEMFWAMAASGGAEVMFARASGPVDADAQAVIFYMYSDDVRALREQLLLQGVRDGGVYSGARTTADGPTMVYAVATPHYMPEGDLRVIDPDGFVVLVGQR